MLDKIKRLGTDTAVYGVSTILGRFLSFLLTPFYANVLPPAELGTVATVYAYVAFLTVLYAHGMESAFFRYTASGEKRETFTTAFVSVSVVSVLFTLLLVWQAGPLAELASVPAEYGSVGLLAAGILGLDALAVIPLAALRMERKAKRFAAIRLSTVAVNVGLNVYFLLSLGLGIEGIFLSNLLSSGFCLGLLVPVILKRLRPGWSGPLLGALLRFGLPGVPAGLASMTVQVINRPILEALTDRATVGIYQANYRLGIVMMLVVTTFDFAWRPFFMTAAEEPDAQPLFARILTYFVLFMTVVFLVFGFFVDDLVRVPILQGRSLLPEAYRSGLPIVPVILLAYLLLGASNTVAAGIYIRKRTGYLPAAAFTGAAVNIAGNYLLIPRFGMMGAAAATLLSYLSIGAVHLAIAQRIYPVPYEWGRLAKIGLAGGLVWVLSLFAPGGAAGLSAKAGLLILFGLLIWAGRFFSAEEARRIAGLMRRRPRSSSPEGTAPASDP
ncbi:MAG: lipopolysaccharide biosynthesis protein [Bacteroidota bacterium]